MWVRILPGSSLVCAEGTPVADMLVHSPPLPIVINYKEFHDITAEYEEGMILAFDQRDRVRCVRLDKPVTSLQRALHGHRWGVSNS